MYIYIYICYIYIYIYIYIYTHVYIYIYTYIYIYIYIYICIRIGEAGGETIVQNLATSDADNDSTAINAMIPGSKVEAIYGNFISR